MNISRWFLYSVPVLLVVGMIVICIRLDLKDDMTASICAALTCALVLATSVCVCFTIRSYEVVVKQPPLSRVTVSLHATPYGANAANDLCAICLVPFEPAASVVELEKCQHVFHVDCISTWVTRKAQCPECRSHLPTVESFIV